MGVVDICYMAERSGKVWEIRTDMIHKTGAKSFTPVFDLFSKSQTNFRDM